MNLRLHEQAYIARHFPEAPRQNAARADYTGKTVAVRMPGGVGIIDLQQFRDTLSNFDPILPQRGQSPGGATQLHYECL